MHGVGALLDRAMILLSSMVEGVIAPMEHLSAQRFANCTRIGPLTIGRDVIGNGTNPTNRLLLQTAEPPPDSSFRSDASQSGCHLYH